METLFFTTHIHAPREKVWDCMLASDTYKQWTKAFEPGSHFVGDWSKGSEMHFVGADSLAGMVSVIEENRKPEFLSIKHVGILMGGIVDTTSDEAKKWAPAFENYTFKEVDGGTSLLVSMDVLPEHKSMFERSWPEALKLLKELAENNDVVSSR